MLSLAECDGVQCIFHLWTPLSLSFSSQTAGGGWSRDPIRPCDISTSRLLQNVSWQFPIWAALCISCKPYVHTRNLLLWWRILWGASGHRHQNASSLLGRLAGWHDPRFGRNLEWGITFESLPCVAASAITRTLSRVLLGLRLVPATGGAFGESFVCCQEQCSTACW